MKICFVILCPTIGGSEKRFARLFEYLSQRKHAHDYWLILPEGLRRGLVEQGILNAANPNVIGLFQRFPFSLYNHYPIRWRGVRIRPLNRLVYMLCAARIRGREFRQVLARFDLIHNVSAVNFLRHVLPGRQPLIHECMDYTLVDLEFPIIREWLSKDVFFNCLSENIYQAYRERSGEARQCRVSVSPCSLVPGDGPMIEKKENMIVFLGRMASMKSPEMFVAAIAALSERRRDFKAFMLGRGPLDHHVDQMIDRLGLTDIIEKGFHPHPEDIMSKALVYVSLQTGDNYPSQALLEAMACGCAVLASDVGETARLVTEETGYRVCLSAGEIAEHLDRMLTEKRQTELMGVAARDKVLREHGVERYANYIEALHERVSDAR